MKALFLIIVTLLFSVSANSQSGRRNTRAPTPPSPVQPPLTPEPETSSKEPVGPLLSVPESFRERDIKALDNTTFKLADFQGKVVVINIWASWCGPCRREVPEYEKIRKAYAGRKVEFIGLTAEDPRVATERVNKFLREVSFGFRLGWADRDTARLLMDGQEVVPQTLVLDGEGRVTNHWSGYSTGRSGYRLKQAIDSALDR
jgi:thiol-disulfide isomerase/thioredoxin